MSCSHMSSILEGNPVLCAQRSKVLLVAYFDTVKCVEQSSQGLIEAHHVGDHGDHAGSILLFKTVAAHVQTRALPETQTGKACVCLCSIIIVVFVKKASPPLSVSNVSYTVKTIHNKT